jgi:hypothetical protein
MRHTPAGQTPSGGAAKSAWPSWLPGWLRDRWQFIIFPLALVILFRDNLAGKRFFWEDTLQFAYPSMAYLVDALRNFRIPYWTPFVFSGTPFAAAVYNQTFYPPTWIVALLVNPGARMSYLVPELFAISHLLIAGLTMYVLFRGLGLSKQAALLGGFSFMLSGFMVVRVIHVSIICALAWFPLILLFFHRSLYERRLYWAVLAGLLFGLAILAGFPQFAMFMAYFLGLYAIFFVVLKWRDYRYETIWRSVVGLGAVAGIGIAVAAIQFLPSQEHTKYTSYSRLSFDELTVASLHPRQLLTLLVPKFFGSMSGDLPNMTDSVRFWGGKSDFNYWETVIYAGIIPLILAVFALFERKRAIRWFGLVMGAAALLLALGRFTPVYKAALGILPGLSRFRIPGRLGGLFLLSLTFLVGYGADMFLRKGSERQVKGLLKGLLIAAGVAVLGWILLAGGAFRNVAKDFQNPLVYANSVRQWGYFAMFLMAMLGITFFRSLKRTSLGAVFWLMLAVIFIDLSAFAGHFHASPLAPDEAMATGLPGLRIQRPSVAMLQEQARGEQFRINSRIPGLGMVMGRNQGNLDHLELIEGYAPLGLKRYDPFERPTQRMYDILNVKYRSKLDSTTGVLGLVPNPTGLPRARMVYQYEVLPQEEVVRRLDAADFDHRTTAIVETAPSFASRAADTAPVGNGVSFEECRPEYLKLSVRTAETGMLVLSEMYYPEWKARLDGKPVDIYPVDHALRGVTVPAGEHKVEMYYDPRWFKVGGLISLVTLLFSIGLLVLLRPGRTARKPEVKPAVKPAVDKAGE